jgi:hypothetical protein
MRYFTLLSFFLVTQLALAQMSGEIATDGRNLLTPFNYLLKGNHDGVITVEIAVNIDGNVTSVQVLRNETSIVSTPTQMMVKEEVKKLKFEKGYHFPKFHRAKLKITIEKG